MIDLCGPHQLSTNMQSTAGYRVFEYWDTLPLSHVSACANLMVSRAGATTIYELLMLDKPNILYPLSTQASRGG